MDVYRQSFSVLMFRVPVEKKSQSVSLSTVSCDFLWAWVVWVGPGEEQGFGLQQSLGRNVDVLVLKK